MSKSNSFGSIDFNLVSSMDSSRGTPLDSEPFRILVLGDFSGRGSRGICDPHGALASGKLRPVDRDELENVMEHLCVRLRLPLSLDGGDSTELTFVELDDFHPDRLYENLELFREIEQKIPRSTQVSPPAARLLPDETLPEGLLCRAVEQTPGSLLDQILDGAPAGGESKETTVPVSSWDRFLNRVVSPYSVSADDPAEQQAREIVEDAAGEVMRALLQYPAFKELEAAWRGLKLLVYGLETGEELQIVLLDVTMEEIRDDLNSSEDLSASALFRLLVQECEEEPWGLVVGNYTFDASNDDIVLLGRLAQVASAADAPCVVAAGQSFLAGRSAVDLLWEQFRRLPSATYLGLAIPRFLLRLPYGKRTDPLESFAFEEMPAIPVHSEYLWGNPAFAVGRLLGESFAEHGWGMVPGVKQDLEGLPLHTYRVEGESRIAPTTEQVFTVEQCERIMEAGFMPLLSFRERDMVRIARFQSIAAPPTLLAGRWR